MGEILKLGENHRRAISVMLRGLERMCDDVESCLAETDGVLRRMRDDLSSGQRDALRRMTLRVRAEIRRLAGEIELDTSVLSPRRRIHALISSMIVNLEETDAGKLSGYGALPQDAVNRLQVEFTRLHALLEEMSMVVARD